MRVLVEYIDNSSLSSTEAKLKVKNLLSNTAVVKTIPDTNEVLDFLVFAAEELISDDVISAFYKEDDKAYQASVSSLRENYVKLATRAFQSALNKLESKLQEE